MIPPRRIIFYSTPRLSRPFKGYAPPLPRFLYTFLLSFSSRAAVSLLAAPNAAETQKLRRVHLAGAATVAARDERKWEFTHARRCPCCMLII